VRYRAPTGPADAVERCLLLAAKPKRLHFFLAARRNFVEFSHLLCLRIASSSSSSDRGEMPSA
jgi:hypothetical protein